MMNRYVYSLPKDYQFRSILPNYEDSMKKQEKLSPALQSCGLEHHLGLILFCTGLKDQ